jgi:uncharacterized protein
MSAVSKADKQPAAPPTWRDRWRGPYGAFGSVPRVLSTTIVIFIFSQFVAALFVELIYQAAGGRGHLANVNDSAVLQALFILAAEALAIWLVLSIVKRRGLKLAAIGLGRRPQWSDGGWAIGGFLVFYAFLFCLALILSIVSPDLELNQNQDVGFNSLAGAGNYIIAFISLVILPPLGEETLVRGYLYSGLRSKLKYLPALLITSLLFGVAHLQTDASGAIVWEVAADTFLLSAVLVFLREKTGVLYAAIGVHILNNLVAFFVHFHS